MAFRLTHKAEDDLVDIAEQGYRLFGVNQAERYHEELFDLFQLLAENPRIARERHELSRPVRIHPFKAHIVVYLVQENDDVLIVRVRHGRENWATEPIGN